MSCLAWPIPPLRAPMPLIVPAVSSLPAAPAVVPKSPAAVPAPPSAACSAAAKPTGSCAPAIPPVCTFLNKLGLFASGTVVAAGVVTVAPGVGVNVAPAGGGSGVV
jgi:hypothetical protein